MTKVFERVNRMARDIQKATPKVSKRELDARWVYNNTAIEYPEARLKDARAIASKKKAA